MVSRDQLPFRKNTEGYFLDSDNNILAHDTGVGYLEFPGGGIEPNETPKEGILRETFEETGAIIDATTLKKLGVMRFLWDGNWAKTEKQKQRYQQFKGEEMHFFFGRINGWKKIPNASEAWEGKKLIPIHQTIRIIENEKATKAIEEYRSFQLKLLKKLKSQRSV